MEFIVVFFIGFFVSVLGSMTSGIMAALSLGLLMFTGLSPLAALGVHRVGALSFQLSVFYKLLKHNQVVWSQVIPLTLIGVPAAFIGGFLVLSLDEELLGKIFGGLLLMFIPISVMWPHLGVHQHATSKLRKKIGYGLYALSSVWGSSVIIGVGFLTVYTHAYFLGNTILQTKATTKIPAFIKGVIVLSMFAYAGYVDWQLSLVFAAGMALGGYIGTHYAIKLGNMWLKNILLVTLTGMSIKLIFGL